MPEMNTKSFLTSYFALGFKTGVVPSDEVEPIVKVYPSGFARATYSVPMTPPPPNRFSTVTGDPSISLIFSDRILEIVSLPVPGPKATTKLIGRFGNVGSAYAEDITKHAAKLAQIFIKYFRKKDISTPYLLIHKLTPSSTL
jgi:hypothetical protein